MRCVDVLIIGAGLSGVVAGRRLLDAQNTIQLVEKSASIGGRLANKRFDGAFFDTGAQFFTAKDPIFQNFVSDWVSSGIVKEWYSDYPGALSKHPRYRGSPAMNTIAKNIATRLPIKFKTKALRICNEGKIWKTSFSNDEELTSKAILITTPVPQAIEIINHSNVVLDKSVKKRLSEISYESCYAIMATLEKPSKIPSPGSISITGDIISWISDNQQKGISQIPSITIHSNLDYAQFKSAEIKNLDQSIIKSAEKYTQTKVKSYQTHFWRYSKPLERDPQRFIEANTNTSLPPIFLAGDAMAGPRVEGAFLSGFYVADAIANNLR